MSGVNWKAPILRNQQTGFTLIEVLASLVIVSIGLAALIPVLSLIAYRRALSERTEVANQLARSELDRIRTVVDLGPGLDLAPYTGASATTNIAAFTDDLPNVVSALPLSSAPAPATLPLATDNPNAPTGYSVRLAEVDIPGRPQPEEYAIQTFRTQGEDCVNPTTLVVINGLPCSFTMGVRVYHRFSFDPATRAALSGLGTATLSASREISNAEAWLNPMANLQVEINLAAGLDDICVNIADPTDAAEIARCDAI